jgi:hypothetical protein
VNAALAAELRTAPDLDRVQPDRALADYFRCPDGMAGTGFSRTPSGEEGFFKFGNVVCHGHFSGSVPSAAPAGLLPQAEPATGRGAGAAPALPFDLSEVVTNLRRERYRAVERDLERRRESSLVHALYYFFRPVLPVAVRKHLQRIRLSDWDTLPFPSWPVDVSVDALMREVLALLLRGRGLQRMPFIWFWPDGAPGCAIVTHDVEGPAGRDLCGALMDLDESFGVRSAFQVVPEVNWMSPVLIQELRRRGFEVNVHDLNHDGRLFRERGRFQERAAQINRYARLLGCRGFRSGAMYREQDWYDALEVSYDMSVPNVAHLEPQRGGCCTVMPYFVGRILELPLTTTEDYTLFHILGDYSTALWRRQVDLVLANNGLVTVLAHPDYLIEQRARQVYRDLLSYLCARRDEERLWMALPGDVDRWWRDRAAMRLVSGRDGSWRIEGTGSSRARVAYASLDGGRLVFELEGSERGPLGAFDVS